MVNLKGNVMSSTNLPMRRFVAPLLAVAVVLLGACAAPGGSDSGSDTDKGDASSLDQAAYDKEDADRTATFEGDPAQPYLQYLPGGEMVDPKPYARTTPGKVCFSNASLSNVWRQTGWITMYEQYKVLKDQGVISDLVMRDAQDDENTQVSDIDFLIKEGDCDAFIIAPATVEATASAIGRACETGKPVVVFDRGTTETCIASFVHSIGGYAWGIDSASFLADQLEEGDTVVALRTAPGVDVFEQRWAAATKIFKDAGLKVTDHITGADPAEIKSVMADELTSGEVDGVWVDLGDQAVPAIEAFQDAGMDIPAITGEDNMAYLRAWDELGFNGFAPVYSNFQWRTALLAVAMLFQGEEIPKDWTVPQTPITGDELPEVIKANAEMPDVHSARCGCEDMPSFPGPWVSRKTP